MHLSSSKEQLPTILLFDNDGFSDYTCYLAKGLAKYGNIIVYSFSEESPKVTGAASEKRIKFVYIKKRLPKGYSAARGIIRVFFLFFILIDALLRTKYDIVHIQNYLPTFFLFIPILKFRRKQIFWTLHDLDLFSLWQNLFATGINGRLQVLFNKMVTQPTLLAKCVDRILVHALSIRQQLIAKNVNENKIVITRHFDYRYLLELTDENAKNVDNFALKRDYILFIGNIAPWKGINTLLEAAKIVKNKMGHRFKLVIAGKPYPGFKNVQFFKNLDDEDAKFITIINKYITNSEIPVLLSKCSFVVLPYHSSFQYCTSGVITLSSTFAKPVIVSNVPSLAEYVENGKTGLIFESNDSEQLASCMIDLIEDNSKCIRMGKMALQKMVNEMTLELHCKKINDAYSQLET